MNRLSRLALAGVLAAAAAFAQSAASCNSATPAICTMGTTPTGDVQVKPQSVPTSTTTVTGVDAYLKQITVTNTTGSPVTFTLADKQASPVAVLSAVSIAANTTYVIRFADTPYWCPGGFTVAAGGSGLTWYGSWRQ